MSSELVEGGAELLRIETFYRPPGQSEGGVRVVIHVSPQDALGHVVYHEAGAWPKIQLGTSALICGYAR